MRDILGKDTIQQTTEALSDLAETILIQVAAPQWAPLERALRHTDAGGGRARRANRVAFVLFALGKFGGRELNYHSDLDLVFVYEADGRTAPPTTATRFCPV